MAGQKAVTTPDFISDEDMKKLEGGHTPDFISDEDMARLAPDAPSDVPPTQTPSGVGKSLYDRVTSYLPSWHGAAVGGGAAIGGALGAGGGTILGTPIGGIAGAATGGAAGASIGESLYQLVNRALGRPAPQTGGEAAIEQAKALASGALQEGVPAAVSSMGPQAAMQGAINKVGETVHARSLPPGVARNVEEVAGEAAPQMPIAMTDKRLLAKLNDFVDEGQLATDKAYNDVINKFPNTQLSADPIIAKLKVDQAKYMTRGNATVGLEPYVEAYQNVIDWLKANKRFTVAEFRNAKKGWDSALNFDRPGYTPDPAKVRAMEEATNGVRESLHAVFPSLEKADRNSHVWLTLRDALSRSVERGFGMEHLAQYGGRGTIGGLAGGLAAHATGMNPFEGIAAGAILSNLSKTAAWNTLSVKERVLLAKTLQNALAQGALKAGTTVGMSLIPEDK